MLTAMRLMPAPLRRRVLDGAEVPCDLATVTSVAVADDFLSQAALDGLRRLLSAPLPAAPLRSAPLLCLASSPPLAALRPGSPRCSSALLRLH